MSHWTKAIGLTVFSTLFVGCIEEAKPPVNSRNGGAASFFYTQFSGTPLNSNSGLEIESQNAAANWGFPNQVTYQFESCLQDFRNQNPVQNHKFKVEDRFGYNTVVTSDVRGCINWQKTYDIVIGSPADYVEQQFVVTPDGIHKGTMQLKAIVNPKAIALGFGDEAFVDLIRNKTPGFDYIAYKNLEDSLKSLQSLHSKPYQPRLQLNTFFLNFNNRFPESTGFRWSVEMNANPDMTILGPAGAPRQVSLQRGEFVLQLQFLHYSPRTKQFTVLNKEPSRLTLGRIQQQRLNAHFEVLLRGEIPTEGQLMVHLAAAPIRALTGAPEFERFSAVYLVGEIDPLPTGGRAQRIDNAEMAAKAQKAVTESLPLRLGGYEPLGPDRGNEDDGGLSRRIDEYHFRVLQMRYGGLDLTQETASSRTVKVLLTSCIQDPLLFRPIRFREFEVQVGAIGNDARTLSMGNTDVSRTDKLILRTDQEGCIRWADRVKHDYYKPEQFFVKEYTITDIHDGDRGAQTTLRAVINPWNTGWLFARDYREVNPEDIRPNPPGGPRARLFMTQYSMSARGTDYKIDDRLNLTVLRKYDLVLTPRVLRHDSQAYGFMGNENLRDGLYLLRLALVRDFSGGEMPPPAFINSWQKVVRVNGGKIAVPVHFAIENLTLIGSRNRLIVDIKPIDENKVVYLPGQESKPLAEKLVDQEKTLSQSNLIRRDTGLVTNVFAGPFIPLYEGQGKSLIESPHLRFEQILEAGETFMTEQARFEEARNSLQIYDKKLRLKHIDFANPDHLDWIDLDRPYFARNAEVPTSKLIEALLRTESRMQNVETELGFRLCELWADRHLPEMLERFRREDSETDLPRAVISEDSYQRFKGFFISWCIGNVTTDSPVFEVERKLEIESIEQDSISYRGGQSFNLVVNSGFRMDKGQGWDVRNNHSGSMSGSLGLGGEFLIFSAGLKRTETFSSSEGESYTMGQGAGLSYGMGAYLVVQHSIFQMAVRAKQQCLIVKPKYDMMRYLMESHLVNLDPDFKREAERGWWFGFGRTRAEREALQAQRVRDLMPESRLLDLMDTGLRICSPPSQPRRLLQEDYYYVTQHFTTGDMHDPTDLKNRPWLLEIRSKRDFNVFLRSLLLHNELSDVGNIEHSPVNILADAYSHYEDHLPTWPGLYTEYPTDVDQSEHCDSTKDMGEAIFGFAKEVMLGPLTRQFGNGYDGYGIDFWEIYYCADR